MLGIIKGDLRYEFLEKEGRVISKELTDFYNIEYLLLPFMGIDNYYNIKQTNLNLLDILRANDIKIIFVGKANEKLVELCHNRDIRLVELLEDEDFVISNAKLTAMGIIDYLHRKNIVISDERIFILGYGNISYSLAKLLKAYNCDFSILSFQHLENKYIKLEGYNKGLLTDLENYSIIINTIPNNIKCDYKIFKNKYILDVASEPYGFDLELISSIDCDYEIYRAIPSKFVPISAAKLIDKKLEKYLKKNKN